MYEAYWQLQDSPFRNDCNPRFWFAGRGHHAALLKLKYLVQQDLGGGVVAGASGLGKTYLTHVFASRLPEGFGPVFRVVYPQLNAEQFLAYLAAELGAEEEADGGTELRTDRALRQIEGRLKALAADGRHPVLVVDDAHLVEDERMFRCLQLLLNFRHGKPHVSFSLLLVGEPVLLGRLTRFATLNELLPIKSVLQPLTEEETAEYVRHRLREAGATRMPFDDAALRELHAASGGVPRRINRLCDLALLVGFADRLAVIGAAQIEAVAAEVAAVVPD